MDSLEEIQGLQNSTDPPAIRRLGRNEGESPDRLEQAHFSEGSLHGNGIRFYEVDVHQSKILEVEAPSFGKIAGERGLNKASHFRRNFVGGDGDQAAATERDETEGQGFVTAETEESPGNEVKNRPHLRVAAGRFFSALPIWN